MKITLRPLVAAVLLAGMATTANAQEEQKVTFHAPKNEIKLNLPSLALGNLSLQYERSLVPGLSAALGFRYGAEAALPFSSLVESSIGDDPSAKQLISSTRMSNYAVTPEVRYYFGKGDMKGFYVGVFGRIGEYNLKTVYTLDDPSEASGTRQVALKGSYNYGGVGMQLGVKWMLSKRISLDWWMLGPMYTSGKLKLDAAIDLSSMPQSYKTDAETDLKKTFDEASVTNSGISIGQTLATPGIRTGLAIGFRF